MAIQTHMLSRSHVLHCITGTPRSTSETTCLRLDNWISSSAKRHAATLWTTGLCIPWTLIFHSTFCSMCGRGLEGVLLFSLYCLVAISSARHVVTKNKRYRIILFQSVFGSGIWLSSKPNSSPPTKLHTVTPISEVDQEWDQADEHGNPVPDVSASSSWATCEKHIAHTCSSCALRLAPLQKVTSNFKHQIKPAFQWICGSASFHFVCTQSNDHNDRREEGARSSWMSAIIFISCLCQEEVLVMLVNEFVLSTEIVVQKCGAKYFCTAFTRGYQNHSNFATSHTHFYDM